jgi:hypothetical protein
MLRLILLSLFGRLVKVIHLPSCLNAIWLPP